jgi:hypothetical protein
VKLATRAISAIAITLALASEARATTINLSFNSLPSAQGFTYITDGPLESSVAHVNGSELFFNTLGTGVSEPVYLANSVVNTTDPFVLGVRLKVDGTEGIDAAGPQFYGFAMEVRTAAPNQEYEFGFGSGFVSNESGAGGAVKQSVAVDTSQFHTYVLSAVPGGPFNFFIDGTLVLTGGPCVVCGNPVDGVEFGDEGGFNNNASVEVACLSYSQPGRDLSACSAAAVPEPATMTLTALGFAALTRTWRKRGRRAGA